MADAGAVPAQRPPDRRRLPLHAVRDGQAVRVSGGHHARRGHRADHVAARHRRSARGVWGPVPPRRTVHSAGGLRPGGRDGRGVFPGPRATRLLAGAQSGASRHPVLLCLALSLRRRAGAVEPGCQAGEVNPSTAPSSRVRSLAPSGCSPGPRCCKISSAGCRAWSITPWWDTSWGTPATPRSASPSRSDRKSTRLNSSHLVISYAVFCLKKKKDNSNRAQLTYKYHETYGAYCEIEGYGSHLLTSYASTFAPGR